tara:strand:- start:399 stop:590 length:192 start_codon:yes stop_codon:yes gene_type:complete
MSEDKIKDLEKLLEIKDKLIEKKQQEIRELRRVVREVDEENWELGIKIFKMQKSQEGKGDLNE